MEQNYAVIEDNVVVNLMIINSDNLSDWSELTLLPAEPWTEVGDELIDGSLPPEPVTPEVPKPTFAEVYSAKYSEIIAGADSVIRIVQSSYSLIEVNTWDSQEAGAMHILGKAKTETINEGALLIYESADATALAIASIEVLASYDGVDSASFAARIWKNAQDANTLMRDVWGQQRVYEMELKTIGAMPVPNIEDIYAMDIAYVIPKV